MADGFIIMQIGNKELDKVCKDAIVTAIEACDIEPKRVDKHNQGGLLKSEIIDFIERSDIIVADLTNERPNCYLEIGYTMGINKFRNLILTAREDHNPESPNYIRGGPKIHFDLIGYDILFWYPDKLTDFRDELEKRIKRRRAILTPSTERPTTPWDEEWIKKNREDAYSAFELTKKTGLMEIRFALSHPKPNKTQRELDEAARTSEIRTFGWPIGVYMTNVEGCRAKPKVDGIVAKILLHDNTSLDYWAIHRNGDYYLLKTIFEDDRDHSKLFFDTRIIRITETLLYCARLYNRLEIDPTTVVHIAIKHGGLKDRMMGVANRNRFMFREHSCIEDEAESSISTTLSGLETNLVDLVKQFTLPLFTLFNFFEIDDGIHDEIINAYVQGRIA